MELNSLLIITLIAMLLPAVFGGSCTSSSYYNISERTPPSTVVYRVPRGYSMSFISDRNVAASFNKHFNTSNSSVVTVSSTIPLNRNVMALELGRSILPVTYTLTYIDYSASVLPPPCQIVMFYVTGQDNMVPNFTRSAVNFSILEGSGTPSSWPMDLAIDYDEGINSTKNYYIDSPIANATFYLDMTRDSVGAITILQLRRRIAIDREVTSSFNFTIVAEEGRPNALKGYQRIYINVEDVCDFVPAFPITKYQTEAPENTSVSSVVLTVKAIDLDEGRNELMTYSIASQCAKKTLGESCQSGNIYPADGSAPFALDRVSGNLILIQKLDFNKAQEIDLVVLATDACNLVGTAQVQVTVSHVDDKPPTIQVILVSNGAIREDYTLVSDVATVLIMSPVSFSVAIIDNSTGLVSDTFYLVTIDSSYRMRLLRSLDSKVQSSYNITIKATDSRNNVAHSTVSITVLAVNHPLVFDNTTAFVSIFDNTANGTVVLRVHASDSDLGGNGMVTYELPPSNATFPYQNNFTIKTTEGELLVNGALNRKVAKSFILLIKARDNPTNGDPYYSDSMIVNVTLLDPNGNRPIFSIQSSQINVNENTVMGTRIFQITSYNPEGVPNGTVIAYGLAPNSAFQIDSVSGWISVVNILNNSATKRYILNVTAYNGFPPPSSFILTINILPGDTVGPVFVPRSYTVLVMRTAAVGSHVVDVKAVDMYSTALRYEIVDGNGDGRFSINPANGTISVLKQLDQSATQTYTLHVKASDPTFYSKWLAEVVISLQDLVFVNTPYYFQVQEGVPAGTVVGSISVHLSSSPSSGQLRYYIANGSDALSVDPTSGTITTKRPLSATTNSIAHTISVQAVYTPGAGQGPVGVTALQDVSVFVVQRQSRYNVTLRGRSLEVGTTVLNVSAANPSSVGVTTYSLTSPNPVPFLVDASTGSVYTTMYLDSTPKYTYTFGIVATYSGSSPSPTAQMLITVTIQVDLSISFDATAYAFSVLRNLTKGALIGTVRAIGRRNADIYYNFSRDDPKAYFQIGNTTGQISLLVDATELPAVPLMADVLAHDLLQDSLTPTLWSVVPVSITSVAPSAVTSSQTTHIIIIAAIIGGVLLLLLLILLVALLTLRRKKHYNPKVSDGDGSHAHNRCEMQTFGGGGGNDPASLISVKPAEAYPEPSTARRETVDSPNEGESPPKDAPVYGTDSLSRPPKHIRSTSDLASTVGTELLSGPEDSGPYTKAQLMAIYAANAQLLQDDVSQDSVHMFGSEGGVEADDQEVDIDRMLFAKAIGFEDDHGCTSETPGGRDTTKDEQSVCSIGGLDPHAERDEREQQPRYHFSEKESWLPAVTSVTDTIDELVGRDPRLFSNDRLSYPLSQAMSLYSEGGSQSLLMRSQPAPHQYYGGGGGGYTPQSLHESGYFNETDHHGRQARVTKHRPPPSDHRYEAYPRATSGPYPPAQRVHRYSSTTAISHPHPHLLPNTPHSMGPQRKHAPPQSNVRPLHTPSSNTPTDDGLMEAMPSQRVPTYYSSISSLASTNLSQPGTRDRTLF